MFLIVYYFSPILDKKSELPVQLGDGSKLENSIVAHVQWYPTLPRPEKTPRSTRKAMSPRTAGELGNELVKGVNGR